MPPTKKNNNNNNNNNNNKVAIVIPDCLKEDFISHGMKEGSLRKNLKDLSQFLADPVNDGKCKKFLKSTAKKLMKEEFIANKDKDVRLLIALSLKDILRIYAPNDDDGNNEDDDNNIDITDIFNQQELSSIFQLFIQQFERLSDSNGPMFHHYHHLIEKLAEMDCFNLMLDLPDSQELLVNLFFTLFKAVTPENSATISKWVLKILITCMTDVQEMLYEQLDCILGYLVPPKRNQFPASFQLSSQLLYAMKSHLQPFIGNFINKIVLLTHSAASITTSKKKPSNKGSKSPNKRRRRSANNGNDDDDEDEDEDEDDDDEDDEDEGKNEGDTGINDIIEGIHHDVYEIIFQLNKISPELLLTVMPNLSHPLKVEENESRIKCIQLITRMLVDGQSDKQDTPAACFASNYTELFNSYLQRFYDKEPKIRLLMIEGALKVFQTSQSSSLVVKPYLEMIGERLLDTEEKVRVQAVDVVCRIAISSTTFFSEQLLNTIFDRLRDRRPAVRKQALRGLASVYHHIHNQVIQDVVENNGLNDYINDLQTNIFNCIPSKILIVYKNISPSSNANANAGGGGGGGGSTTAGSDTEMKLLIESLTCRYLLGRDSASPILSLLVFLRNLDESAWSSFSTMISTRSSFTSSFLKYIQLRETLGGANAAEKSFQDVNMKRITLSLISTLPRSVDGTEMFRRIHEIRDNNVFKKLRQLADPTENFSVASLSGGGGADTNANGNGNGNDGNKSMKSVINSLLQMLKEKKVDENYANNILFRLPLWVSDADQVHHLIALSQAFCDLKNSGKNKRYNNNLPVNENDDNDGNNGDDAINFDVDDEDDDEEDADDDDDDDVAGAGDKKKQKTQQQKRLQKAHLFSQSQSQAQTQSSQAQSKSLKKIDAKQLQNILRYYFDKTDFANVMKYITLLASASSNLFVPSSRRLIKSVIREVGAVKSINEFLSIDGGNSSNANKSNNNNNNSNNKTQLQRLRESVQKGKGNNKLDAGGDDDDDENDDVLLEKKKILLHCVLSVISNMSSPVDGELKFIASKHSKYLQSSLAYLMSNFSTENFAKLSVRSMMNLFDTTQSLQKLKQIVRKAANVLGDYNFENEQKPNDNEQQQVVLLMGLLQTVGAIAISGSETSSLIDATLIDDVCKFVYTKFQNGQGNATHLKLLGCISRHFDTSIIVNNVKTLNNNSNNNNNNNSSSYSQFKKLQEILTFFSNILKTFFDTPIDAATYESEYSISIPVIDDETEDVKDDIALAASLALLRTSRKSLYHDLLIDPDIYGSLVMMTKHANKIVRSRFLHKVYEFVTAGNVKKIAGGGSDGLSSKKLSLRHSVLIALFASDVDKELQSLARAELSKIIIQSREFISRHHLPLSEKTSYLHPEYILPHLIHVLAHHRNFPSTSTSAFDNFVRPLSLTLELLLHGAENYTLLMDIVEAMKLSEDGYKKNSQSVRIYTLCDISISLIKRITEGKHVNLTSSGSVFLPTMLFLPSTQSKGAQLKNYLPQGFEPHMVAKPRASFGSPIKQDNNNNINSNDDDNDDGGSGSGRKRKIVSPSRKSGAIGKKSKTKSNNNNSRKKKKKMNEPTGLAGFQMPKRESLSRAARPLKFLEDDDDKNANDNDDDDDEDDVNGDNGDDDNDGDGDDNEDDNE